jgi:hypothetical protein
MRFVVAEPERRSRITRSWSTVSSISVGWCTSPAA